MGLRKKIFVSLSNKNQDRVSGWLVRTGLALRAPPFKAWSRAFECWGADPLDLREAFAQAHDAGPSLVASLHLETLALARGMATFTVDPPGWGESGLTGNRCRSAQDLQHCVQLVVDFLQGHPRICPDAIGIFGVDLGGLLAFYCAGLAPCFAAAAGLGSMFYLKQVWPRMPALQKRRIYRYTGLETPDELARWVDQLEIETVLSRVSCPTLIVHGEKDTLVGPENACALAGAVRGETEVEIIPDEDYLCIQTLFQGVADRIFDWLAERLRREMRQSRVRQAGWLALQEMSFKCPGVVS